jgi:aspartate racemase
MPADASSRMRARRAASKRTRRRKIDAMKTIGLIGGMSWESTLPYYRQINGS